MIKKLKSIFVGIVALSLATAPALVLAPAAFADVNPSQISQSLCSGTNFNVSGTSSDCQTGASTDNLNTLLAKIITIFSAVVGVIAVLMIIVGGLRYITSGGDSNKVSAAKTTIIYALVGLVIVALAQLIVHFVLNQSSTLAG